MKTHLEFELSSFCVFSRPITITPRPSSDTDIKLEITMTRKSGIYLHLTYGALNSCFDHSRFPQQCTPWYPPLEIEWTTTVCRSQNSTTGPLVHATYKWYRINKLVNSESLIRCRVSASVCCGCWFDLQGWRSRCALMTRPNKVETAVQCSVCHV